MRGLLAAATATALLVTGCAGLGGEPADEGDLEACTLFQEQLHKTYEQQELVESTPKGANRDREANELNGMLWETKETARFAEPRANDPILKDGLLAYLEDGERSPHSAEAAESAEWLDDYCQDLTGVTYQPSSNPE